MDFKAPGSFEIHWTKQHLVNNTGLVGIVNATVYMTKSIFTGLQHGKLSYFLTHWGRVTHICVGKLTIIVSDNGLSPGRRQVIIWTNAGILLIEPLGTNFSEISIGIQIFSFTKMPLKMPSAKWRPFCLGLNVLTPWVAMAVVPWLQNRASGHVPVMITRAKSIHSFPSPPHPHFANPPYHILVMSGPLS